MKKILVIFMLSLLGCATPYQSEGFAGGYSELQLSENVFKVSFHGNNATSVEKVTDYAILRCAEVTKAKGFRYFVIVNEQKYVSESSYRAPTNTSSNSTIIGNTVITSTFTTGGQTYYFSKPSSENTIVCLNEKPEGTFYDVTYVIPSIRTKYGIPK